MWTSATTRKPAPRAKSFKTRASTLCNLWPLACICDGMQKHLMMVLAMAASGLVWGQTATPQSRRLTFNGKPLTAEQEKRLEAAEREHGVRLPDRAY